MKVTPRSNFVVGELPPPPDTRQLFAFIVVQGVPQVEIFPNTPDGRRDLADVLRSGMVVGTVIGHPIQARQTQVISLSGELAFENHELELGMPNGTQES